jgi:predicted O-methyltransferase YrrM
VAITFRAPQRAVELAVERMKTDGVVHPDATFNPSAPGELRREIAYYDRDFMYRLGRSGGGPDIVDAALSLLKEHGLVENDASYDADAFEKHIEEVRSTFEGTWTTLSPAMQRLIYMLTSVRRPSHLLELGSFWGFTLACFAGPCVGTNRTYAAERIIGVDVDAAMTERARGNFARLENTEVVRLIAEDARTALDGLPGPFDFVYIEAKGQGADGLYLALLKQVYDRLGPGAWVIAHDSVDWSFAEEMRAYLPFVRDRSRFAESVAFEIDECGLELSIR